MSVSGEGCRKEKETEEEKGTERGREKETHRENPNGLNVHVGTK